MRNLNLKQKFVIDETFTMDVKDPVIRAYILQVLGEFQGSPEEIVVTSRMYLPVEAMEPSQSGSHVVQ
jgi:hypothetical protein